MNRLVLTAVLLLPSICVLNFFAAPLHAEVHPSPIFTNGAVLQRDTDVRVWGTCDPGENVTVSFAGQRQTATGSADGKWMVTLAPMKASTESREMTFISDNDAETVTIRDVLVGEVWLAGGQSNMETEMFRYRSRTQPDIESANDPLLRMLTVPQPTDDARPVAPTQWDKSIPENVGRFSATAYYFARDLRAKLNVPIGIVRCAYGGTPAETWMSRETFLKDPQLKPIIDAYDQHVKTAYRDEADYIAQSQKYEQDFATFYQASQALKKAVKAGDVGAKKELNKLIKPKPVVGPRYVQRPTGLYETMLEQTIPYTVRGVIWYQGENNARNGLGQSYRRVFSALIDNWRKDFMNPDLPFLFVQLAPVGWGREPFTAELRDAQKWVDENVPNTGMVVLLDGGDKGDIHPNSKDKAGGRLALLARKMVYGENDLVATGPRLKNVEINGDAVELTFEDVGSELVLKSGGENTFQVCGADGKYVPAEAKLIDGRIVVSAESIKQPRHVRYGWHVWVDPTLFNAGGLPASPFRTDDFPLVTEGNVYLQELVK